MISFGNLSKTLQILIVVNIAVFILLALGNAFGSTTFIRITNALALVPSKTIPGVWSVFTYMFLHGSLMHLLFNMLALWMFGDSVARELGDKKFAIFFLSAGVFAGTLSAVLYYVLGADPAIIGASGAVVAVVFAFSRYNPDGMVLVFFVLPMKVKHALYAFIGWDILGFFGVFGGDGIAHLTHLSGYLFAALYYYFFVGATYSPGMQFRGTEESAFTNISGKIKNAFHSDKKERDYDIHSPHDSNEMLDKVLKKVSEYGVNSLSEKEKQFLEKVSEQRRKQQGNNIHRMDDYK